VIRRTLATDPIDDAGCGSDGASLPPRGPAGHDAPEEDPLRDTLRGVVLGACTTVSSILLLSFDAWAQLSDQTQAPNAAGAGIAKSLSQQVGAGQDSIKLGVLFNDPTEGE
jgi:hypothetical protein